MPLRGRAGPNTEVTSAGNAHMHTMSFFFLLLSLSLLPVEYVMVRNYVFSGILVPLESKNAGIYNVLQDQGRKSSKTPLFNLSFSQCVENNIFCDVFSTRGFKCIVNTSILFTFITSGSQSKPAKNTGICSALRRQNAKIHDVFEAIFDMFSARAPQVRKQSFLEFLPPLIRTQEGVKSQNMAKLHQEWTFCLSQSLPQSSDSKSWGRLFEPKNVVNDSVAFYLQE